MYLDITIDLLADNIITIFDKDELIEAVKLKDSAPKDYILAHNTKENKYINRNHKETINKLMNKQNNGGKL